MKWKKKKKMKLPKNKVQCKNCGYIFEKNIIYCPYCGATL